MLGDSQRLSIPITEYHLLGMLPNSHQPSTGFPVTFEAHKTTFCEYFGVRIGQWMEGEVFRDLFGFLRDSHILAVTRLGGGRDVSLLQSAPALLSRLLPRTI